MSQFHVLSNYELPAKDSIMSRDANNEIIADSCDIRLYYSTYYGDSLSQMKMTAYELQSLLRRERAITLTLIQRLKAIFVQQHKVV